MDACATYCQTEAATNGDGKYCCDFQDNSRSTTTDTTTADQTTTEAKTYNECFLELFTDGMMVEERTHTAFKFKVQSDVEDTTVIQAAKVFSFVSYSNMGLVTDRDGTDEIVRAELELHKDGTDTFDYLLE